MKCKTTFANILGLCGLSKQDAADFLGVNLVTIKKWYSGKSNVPANVFVMLANHWHDIEEVSKGADPQIEIHIMNYMDVGLIEAASENLCNYGDAYGRAGAVCFLKKMHKLAKTR